MAALLGPEHAHLREEGLVRPPFASAAPARVVEMETEEEDRLRHIDETLLLLQHAAACGDGAFSCSSLQRVRLRLTLVRPRACCLSRPVLRHRPLPEDAPAIRAPGPLPTLLLSAPGDSPQLPHAQVLLQAAGGAQVRAESSRCAQPALTSTPPVAQFHVLHATLPCARVRRHQGAGGQGSRTQRLRSRPCARGAAARARRPRHAGPGAPPAGCSPSARSRRSTR